MKTILLLSLLALSGTSFAKTHQLLCKDKNHSSLGSFGVTLNNRNLDPKSHFFRIGFTSWTFMYSTASPMTCSQSLIDVTQTESFSCIGYNSAGGLTEVSIDLVGGVGTAKVHNIADKLDRNIYSERTEGMVLSCRLITLNQ